MGQFPYLEESLRLSAKSIKRQILLLVTLFLQVSALSVLGGKLSFVIFTSGQQSNGM